MIASNPATIALSAIERHVRRAIEPTAIKQITGGSVNYVYEFNDDLIVRICSAPTALSTFRKEMVCMKRASAVCVHTPEVVANSQIDHYAVMIMRKIDGDLGVDAKGRFPHVWHELGRYARRINSIPVDGFGQSFHDPVAASRSWSTWVDNQRNNLFNETTLWHRLLTRQELQCVEARLEQLGKLEFSPVLCHGNISLRNVVVDNSNTVYLLDWGSAGGFPWYWDIAEVVAWHKPEHGGIERFCEGYGIGERELQTLHDQIEWIKTWRWMSSIRWGAGQGGNWQELDFICLSLEQIKRSIAAEV